MKLQFQQQLGVRGRWSFHWSWPKRWKGWHSHGQWI